MTHRNGSKPSRAEVRRTRSSPAAIVDLIEEAETGTLVATRRDLRKEYGTDDGAIEEPGAVRPADRRAARVRELITATLERREEG